MKDFNEPLRQTDKLSREFFKTHFNTSVFTKKSFQLIYSALRQVRSSRGVVASGVKFGFLSGPYRRSSGVNFIDSLILDDSNINLSKHSNSSFNDMDISQNDSICSLFEQRDQLLKFINSPNNSVKIRDKSFLIDKDIVFTAISKPSEPKESSVCGFKDPLSPLNPKDEVAIDRMYELKKDSLSSSNVNNTYLYHRTAELDYISNYIPTAYSNSNHSIVENNQQNPYKETSNTLNPNSLQLSQNYYKQPPTLDNTKLNRYDSSINNNIDEERPITPSIFLPENGEEIQYIGFTGLKIKEKMKTVDNPITKTQDVNLKMKDAVGNGFIKEIFESQESQSSCLNSFDTSYLYEKPKSNFINKEQTPAALPNNLGKTDPTYLKSLIVQNATVEYGNINIIRSFCSFYKFDIPEFEIVRENDVFRCTATFLNINFVSGYKYDKNDAKDDACGRIKEYIIEGWAKIFEDVKRNC